MTRPGLAELIALRLSRRDVLKFSGAASLTSLLGASMPASALAVAPRKAPPKLAFNAVPLSSANTLVVPKGYTARVFFAWGDPISDGPAFKPDASNSAQDQAVQAGMHHDGMAFFSLPPGSNNTDHGLLVVNHEYLDQQLLFADAMKTWTAEKLEKAQNAVGVSVIEIKREGLQWRIVRPSQYARRITSRTVMSISGPARGSTLMQTAADPHGDEVSGTHSNCANGFTPWGTYLTCEENIHNHFAKPSGAFSSQQARYRLPARSGYRWHEFDERFNADLHPNEFNRFGWVVEIDPFDPHSKPVKRTALGRFAHESAFHAVAKDGRVIIYTGDDARFEYIYKFVSRDAYNPQNRAANRDLLDHGTLYVGKFNADGSGVWLPLVHGQNGLTADNGFADQADVLVHARLAADYVGATPMDRPEWIVVHPATGEVYGSLTYNAERGAAGKPARDAANPRDNNLFGQIIRWRESGRNAASTTFNWDLFVIAGDPGHAEPAMRGNIKGDTFACPDTLRFAPDGTLWIGTDIGAPGRGEYANLGNNQLLAVDSASGEIRRFLTGPRGCEITGLTFTPDGTAAFLNIQHPEDFYAARVDSSTQFWPLEPIVTRPRSATIVITKDDGGVIGS